MGFALLIDPFIPTIPSSLHIALYFNPYGSLGKKASIEFELFWQNKL